MPSKSQEPQQQTDTQHTDSFAWPCDPGPPDLFSWPILSPHTSASTCHCFPPSGDHCNTPKEDKPPPAPTLFSNDGEKRKKRGSNLDLVSSFPFHLMVFPDLKCWPSLSNWIFPVHYTLDFRKCTKQDSTAQRISCVSFPFFERDKNTWETSDISSQGCSV